MLMNRGRGQLLVIDVQDRLAPHIAGGSEVVANCCRLVAYARRLGVPVTLTEHYPPGLGATAPAVLEAAGHPAASGASEVPPVLQKISFSCWRDDRIRDRIEDLRARRRDQLVVAGMETHVCVGQTVLDLLGDSRHVFLVSDAVGSRSAAVRDAAIERLRGAGAHIVTQEMVAFEWLERGDHPAFKGLVKLIK
ncbi:MAG: hydrolase [Hyphomicrobiaceae bacterium]|nr:hydrolase [Hyphomicrobiaceae bacterium]